ncbi:Ger(x)C family spore germination protein [Paenibacillus massiliensis]|uniref:Ger(x)C family spore germination protein n=1 Tax=Paenibacillus massiliensis TaxID=225917 RepID=UPI0006843E2F|nr:Ger(x)C family spore germination protein [Paenibacillus massiliensis]
MKIWFKTCCCICCMSLLLTGCWNKRELNELAIVAGLGIDKIDDQYSVTIQVINPSAVAGSKTGGSLAPVATYTIKGKSLFEVFRRVTLVSPRRLYASHLRVVVIGEEAARAGIGHMLDYLSRNYLFRTDFYILVSKQTQAANIMRTLTILEKIPSNKLYASLEATSRAWGATAKVTLDELINEIGTVGKDPVLGIIRIVGDKEMAGLQENTQKIQGNVLLQYDGMAVFHNDKLIGWLNEEEGKAYSYITDSIRSTVEVVPCPQGEGTVTLKVLSAKSKIKGFVINNQPVGAIEVKAQADVGEVSCSSLDLTQEATIRQLEKEMEKYLKEQLEHTVQKAQETFHTDFLGMGSTIHRANPKQWKLWKENWDHHFEQMQISVHVDVQLRGMGRTTNTYEVKQ